MPMLTRSSWYGAVDEALLKTGGTPGVMLGWPWLLNGTLVLSCLTTYPLAVVSIYSGLRMALEETHHEDGAGQAQAEGGGVGISSSFMTDDSGERVPATEAQPSHANDPRPRMSLEMFDQVLHTSAEAEFGDDDGLFHDTLDFQWELLRSSPNKPAPFLVCGPYANGQALSALLRNDLPEGRFSTVHSSRSGEAVCFLTHMSHAYATTLQSHHSVRFVEPLPANLKMAPGFITYSSQTVDELGGSNSPKLKFAELSKHLSDTQRQSSRARTPAPTLRPTLKPRVVRRQGPELILTFSPGSKMGKHLRFLTSKWRKILPKLERLSAGGFQDRFFWTALGSEESELGYQRVGRRGSGGSEGGSSDDGDGRREPSSRSSRHYEHRVTAWNHTMTRLRNISLQNRSCGFEHVEFADETDTHVVVRNLTAGIDRVARAESEAQEEAEADAHACLAALSAFLASHTDVLSMQVRAQYTSFNAEASWIIQSGDRVHHSTPLRDLGLTGIGELIGVSDTGLDDESCFFYDTAKGRIPRSTWDKPVTDMRRRKVVQYISYVDGGDFVEGHGTHVSASIAGILEDKWSMHNCSQGQTLACTGACLKESECRIEQFNYRTCRDWQKDGSCDTWFNCPMYGCDGGDCKATCNDNPEAALRKNTGIAPDAKIAFFDIADRFGNLSTPSDFNRMLFPPSYNAGARIHSNSWGINVGGYLFDDMKIDQFAYEHQDFLIIYAAGNYGSNGYHSIGSPGTTKNALTIGATESGPHRMSVSMDYIAKFSSRGPTYDGRLKPDAVAPGSYIYSARSSGYNNGGTCAFVAMAGTSMAAPIVAGTAALLRQYFKDGHYARHLENRGQCRAPYTCAAFEPSAPLLKALFVNSAVPVKALRVDTTITPLSTPPDLVQGHGRIKVNDVIDLSNTGFSLYTVDLDRLESYHSRSYYFRVDNSTKPLQVTLAWIDPPNSFTAKKQLLHDLDLIVVDEGGHKYFPNGLPGPDEKNNVEKIVIEHPQPQIYTITISAGLLSEADFQAYSIVGTGNGTALTRPAPLSHPRETPPPEPLPYVGWSAEDDQPPAVMLHEILHPCYNACVSALLPSDGVCQQLSVVVTNCSHACEAPAMAEAQELCLSCGCDFAMCGVRDADVEAVKRYRVQSRLILRGMTFKAVHHADTTHDLRDAIASWLGVSTSRVRVLHINGHKVDPVDGFVRRQLFKSRMRPRHGVEVGVSVHADDKQHSNSLRSAMAATYGHLTDHLHEVASRRRDSPLRRALVFDLHTSVVGYKLLPGGIKYDLGTEDVDEPPPRNRFTWPTDSGLTLFCVFVLPMGLLFLIFYRASLSSLSSSRLSTEEEEGVPHSCARERRKSCGEGDGSGSAVRATGAGICEGEMTWGREAAQTPTKEPRPRLRSRANT